MASEPKLAPYMIVNAEGEIQKGCANLEDAQKLAGELAENHDAPMYVFEKVGRMVSVRETRWEGPGN